MAVPQYTYLVADLRTNTILDELPLSEVRFNKPLCACGLFSATWQLDESSATRARDPYELTMPARRAIYAFRDDRPQWGGVLWTRVYDSTTHTVKLGAAEFWSYFDHRQVLPVLAANRPTDYIAGLVVDLHDTEQNEIARRLVALAQQHTGGDIGIEVDAVDSGIFRDRTYRGYELVDVGEALRQLAGVIDGPDIVFDVAPGRHTAPRRVLRLGEPQLGQTGSAHVWEVGGNVLEWSWPSDGTRMVTRAYATGKGIDLGLPIAVAEDPDRYREGWPLLESETGYSTVEDPDTLTDHADADQQAGRLPVVLPQLVTRGDIPPTAAEVDRGDDGRFIVPAGDLFAPKGIDTTLRVIDMAFEPSTAAERVTLTMAPLLDDIA